MYPELLHHIGKYVTLSLEEQDIVCQHFELKQVKKKQHLLQEGQLCEGNYFVVKGCLRLYLINDKLNEQIVQFGLENWWIADQDSLLNHKPSQCYLQALEPAEVLLLPEKNRETLFEQVPQLESYFRIMMQIAFVAAQRRIGFIFNMSDEERYRHFMKLFPAFAQRIPQYMLASYLGFTPQFMSRLRAKKV